MRRVENKNIKLGTHLQSAAQISKPEQSILPHFPYDPV
jgi:hypothetical protein